MDQLVLINPDEHPNDEIIFSHIGRTKSYWISIFDFFHTEHPEFDEEWRYYKDGKSWLLKIINKKNTVCWISVQRKKFKMTFYFTDQAEPAINESTISDELKEQFRTAKYYNKIRPLTITFSNKSDVEYAKSLVKIKLNVK
jgi:hypothetical protein